MIRVEPYRPDHLRELILQDAQAHLQPLIEGPEYADGLALGGPAWTGIVGNRTLICAGFHERWEGNASAWAIVARDASRYMLDITRHIARALHLRDGRIECAVRTDFVQGHRLARLLGFTREGTMKAYCYGIDHDLYAMVR